MSRHPTRGRRWALIVRASIGWDGDLWVDEEAGAWRRGRLLSGIDLEYPTQEKAREAALAYWGPPGRCGAWRTVRVSQLYRYLKDT